MDLKSCNKRNLKLEKVGEDQGLAVHSIGVLPYTVGLVDGNHIFGMVYDGLVYKF